MSTNRDETPHTIFPRAAHPGTGAVTAVSAAIAVVAACALALPACDGTFQQYLDAVPQGETDPGATARVFLGVDGMSRQAFDLARAAGAFSGWQTADLVTPFPGTSDYSWTRTLRAGSLGGYEIQYYDPTDNQVKNSGIEGVAAHVTGEGIAGTLPCYQRFDFLGDGETWQAESYLDPMAAYSTTLDALLDTISGRARTERQMMAYVISVDILSHTQGVDQAVQALIELDRRIRAFKAAHARPFEFTLFADHGNAHLASTLVEPRDILSDVGVNPVDTLGGSAGGDAALEAVPIVHVRVNYVALHAARANVEEIATRTSRSASVDLAVAPLDRGTDGAAPHRFGVWRQGARATFQRADDGTIVVEDPARWAFLGVDLAPFTAADGATATLADRDAFEATRASDYPDVFYRVATAFTHPAARFPADILLSMPDDVASIGFEIPGTSAIRANAGFHGSLSRRSTLAVLASETLPLPPALRSDDLADMFPLLQGERP